MNISGAGAAAIFLISAFSAASSPDSDALLSFRSTSVSSSALVSWNSSSNPCSGSWLGVSCQNGHVSRIVLENLRLDGDLAPLSLLPRLSLLSLANNSLSSPLHQLNLSPWQPHLKLLYLSRNRFSGPFPAGILLLRRLRRLDLSRNLLSGRIPSDIGLRLPKLLTLRLGSNLFIGAVPASVAAITDLSLSYNRLAGEIPSSLSGFPISSFVGNPSLCGRPLTDRCLKLKPIAAPPIPSASKKRNWVVIGGILVLLGLALVISVAFVAILLVRWRRNGVRKGEAGMGGRGRRGEELVFFEGCEEFLMEDLMRGAAEMLGRGEVGTTYRVVMDGGEAAAAAAVGGVVVKRMRRKERQNCAAEERLLKEIGGWRHPNVAGLRAYYSTADELLLVFDYFHNGSLFSLLHGNRGPGRTPLEWSRRLKLAIGAAKGLTFLHSISKSKLSHQNLTSSNILIDEEDNARISDFALHQLLPPSSQSFNSSTELTGFFLNTSSRRRIMQKCDVYSFGVILLEILTGREAGESGGDLAAWVQTVVREEWTSEVFDIEILGLKEVEDEMMALLQIALICLAPEPKDRPRMSMVCKMIEEIKGRKSSKRRGSHSLSSLNDQSNQYSSPSLSEDAPTFTSSSFLTM